MRFFDESIPKFVPALKSLIFRGISFTERKTYTGKPLTKLCHPKHLCEKAKEGF